MNEHQRPEDPAFDRLTAADPAKRAPEPVEGVLRAKVDALISGSGSGAGPGSGRETAGREPVGTTRVDEVAVRRHRRRTPWLVAAAVAGIVAAGGGGYLAGESGPETATTAKDVGAAAESAPDSDSGSGEAESRTDDEPTSVLGAPEEPATEGVQPLDAGGDLASATRLVFHAGVGLTDTPRTAEVRSADGTSLGTYPVVSEEAAVERLGDPRFAPAARGAGQPGSDGDASAEAPAPGGPIAWPVEDVTIVSAVLTEVRYTLPDGAVLLVPAYDLSDAAGSSWTVIAVDEELLDFTP
ncbi:hypothetical protein [Promicromonospora sp. NPDC050262]|uniref:hypothetical protein n=1 Tax=Promicromonospora sp. NPDC050262 TaxID=3155036 RepID=UPI0033D2EAED